MKKLTALLICASAIAYGCASYAPPDGTAKQPPGDPHKPVDSNRNSVPDNLERKAVPLEPIVERATPPTE